MQVCIGNKFNLFLDVMQQHKLDIIPKEKLIFGILSNVNEISEVRFGFVPHLQGFLFCHQQTSRSSVSLNKKSSEMEDTRWTSILTRKEAFAAVMVPWGLTKAGFREAIFSGVEGRIPLSLLMATDLPVTCPSMHCCINVIF
jgi:hypothetical protein